MKKSLYTFIHLVGFAIVFLFSAASVFAQDLDYEAIKQAKDVKINGAISANSIFYNSNQNASRSPFTYFLQGNLNFSWLTFTMPLSYNLTNQGSELNYKVPYNLNRLSIHPKYKWITAHIGEVAMTYSPYTLNAYQFTGAGLDLAPPSIPLKISFMGGRLLKAVAEDEAHPEAIPSFKRMGYGAKIGWEKQKYKVGVIGFYAKDNANSLPAVPDAEGVTPKENLVLSLSGEATLIENLTLNAEYASSAITQDLRSEHSSQRQGLAGLFFGDGRSSTQYYSAYKATLNFNVEKMKWGLGYERIDPGYQTLGAYYFNNDLENITINGSRPFFNNHVNLSFNVGYQRDNLNGEKDQNSGRVVGAVNLAIQPSEKFNINGSYSNFSTYTNRRLNQFDEINNYYDPNQEYIQSFKYQQLAQNANVNVNWRLLSSENISQDLNVNYSLAASANSTDGVIRIGQASNFHNGNLTYNLTLPKSNFTVSSSMNYTYAYVARNTTNTLGPTVNISKRFLKNTLNTTLGASYNNTTDNSNNSNMNVANLRASVSYTLLKKHNFNLNVIQLFRNVSNGNNLSEFTLTLGYNYAFDLGSPKGNKNKSETNF